MSDKINELKSRLDAVDAKLADVNKGPAANTPTPEQVFGSPYARKGESVLSSRGFQFQRLIGVVSGAMQPEEAKIEMDLCDRMRKTHLDAGHAITPGTKFVAPFSADLLGDSHCDNQFRAEVKSLVAAGAGHIDPSELNWLSRKAYGQKSITTNQSWIDETLGGGLVAPPEFGELIQLLRNKDALINAGARVIPMPPSGRIQFPRQTSPTSAYNVGENSSITSSTFGTGKLTLSSKKIAALVSLPNELIRFASPASEALLRADMTKTLSLKLDYDCLFGGGSDNVILGLVNTPNIATVTPTTVGNDGNTLSPQDLLLFPSGVESNNAEFQGWILHPIMFYKFAMARAGVYNGTTAVAYGQFVYDQFRQLGSGFPKMLAGFPAVTTAQVSLKRVKGNGTTLTTVFGGQWDDYLIALFGSIEFAQAWQGDTAFQNDETWVRAILTGDAAPRHPGAFAVADQLVQSVGS